MQDGVLHRCYLGSARARLPCRQPKIPRTVPTLRTRLEVNTIDCSCCTSRFLRFVGLDLRINVIHQMAQQYLLRLEVDVLEGAAVQTALTCFDDRAIFGMNIARHGH